MIRTFVYILTFCLARSLCAQDIYYPLSAGNKWQLSVILSTNPIIYDYINLKIVRDTTMPNGHTYAAFEDYGPFERQVGNQVFIYSQADSQEYVRFDFSRAIGDTSFYFNSGRVMMVVVLDTGTWNIFGEPRRTFTFYEGEHPGIDAYHIITIADSIGPIRITPSLSGDYGLNGAVISGATYGKIVSIEREQRPRSPVLYQNSPNPFNSRTTISFEIEAKSKVKLEVFDVLGRMISVLVDQSITPGFHSVIFEGATSIPSGVYIYRLITDQGVFTRRMILRK